MLSSPLATSAPCCGLSGRRLPAAGPTTGQARRESDRPECFADLGGKASFSSGGGPSHRSCWTSRSLSPARSLASLRWIFNQGKVNVDLQMIQLPRRVASRPHKRGQAAAMEPSMVNHLERRIVQMFEAGEERWSALLGGWLVMSSATSV